MSDHFSGPRALADPAADITDVYAFPSPERPGHLVMVMNVFPLTAATALFSDVLSYRFRVRPVMSVTAGPAFAAGEEEYAFTLTFAAPVQGNGSGTLAQVGTCTAPGGRQVSFRVGDENPAEAHGLRVFAGPRLDPFFIDFVGHITTVAQGKLAFRSAQAVNTLEGQNVLSIVVEADAAAMFGPGASPLLAVMAETTTTGSPSARLERMGRPEIKNFVMQPKQFDTVNRDLEIRDLYNADDAFSVNQEYMGAYRARLNANLAYYDRMDGTIDWPLDQGSHPLTELLLADFLVVDSSKPFSDEGYLEIETALLAGRPHTTCGGRSLNHDMVDTYYTLLVGGVDGPRIGDGVDQATRPATRTFPYLVSPNPNPSYLDLMALLASGSAPQQETAA